MNIKQIEWGDEQKANEECRYNHVIGESPLGKFIITWKGWKASKSYDVDDSPFGWIGSGFSLQDAKKIAQSEYENKILDCLDLSS